MSIDVTSTSPGRQLLYLPDISARTGVPIDTLRFWRQRGQGEGPRTFRLGRRVVAFQEDVEAWIEQQAAREFLASAHPRGQR